MNSHLVHKLCSIEQKIAYYNERMMITSCPYIKNYYGYLIKNEMRRLQILTNKLCKKEMNDYRLERAQREFTLQELAKYDGANGAAAYAAVDGIVYDVSLSSVWGGGTHFGLYAGKDLTNQFKACHNGETKILDSLPKVGVLKI